MSIDLYKLQKNDITKAGKIMDDAFGKDTLWAKIFEDESKLERKRPACFEVPIRMGMKYGEVWATSENIEGLISWVSGEWADFTLWRMLRCGGFSAAMRMGSKIGIKMGKVFPQIAKDRNAIMKGRNYIYIFILGVATQYQGKGYGKKLLLKLIEKCDSEDIPIYLETETETNLKMYEHFGFNLIQKIILPVVNHPMWEMVREAVK